MRFNGVGFRTLFTASALCMLTAVPARAGLIITGADANVTAGSTATITFAISDTSAIGEQLAAFQLQLQITGTAGNGGVLAFSSFSNQPNPYNYSNYVFAGNSFDQSNPGFWDSVTSTVIGGLPDLATGGDFTNTGSTTILSNGSYLLATVQIDATNAVAGDTYQIALVTANTSFQDPNGYTLGYSSTAATITIVSNVGAVSAVPAPSSVVLASIGSLTCLLYYGWMSRRKAPLLRCCADV